MHRNAIPLLLLILSLSLSPTRADGLPNVHDDPRFPFPIIQDQAAGKTGELPNRIQDEKTGMWYVLVPAGQYQIGSNDLPDSKQIKVRLSAYYISETPVSYRQMADYIEAYFETFGHFLPNQDIQAEQRRRRKEFLEGKSKREAEDSLMAIKMKQLLAIHQHWNQELNLKPETGAAINEIYIENAKAGRQEPIVLSESRRTQMKTVFQEFHQALAKMRKKEEIYDQADYHDGELYALWRGVSLPTEAQWEAAARLDQAEDINLEKILAGHWEWCQDLYAHDYFDRKDDFVDPDGPDSASLSEAQLADKALMAGFPTKGPSPIPPLVPSFDVPGRASDSRPQIDMSIISKSLRVLRGRDLSVRVFKLQFDTLESNDIETKYALRLVINPELKFRKKSNKHSGLPDP